MSSEIALLLLNNDLRLQKEQVSSFKSGLKHIVSIILYIVIPRREWEPKNTRLQLQRPNQYNNGMHEDIISRSDDITTRRDDIISRRDDILSRSDDILSRRNDIISRSDDILSRSDDILSRRNDIISHSDD